jgi:hypothetical protein
MVMSAILDIPEVHQRISRLSVEEYHRLDEFNENGRRTELIRGIVIEKMSKSPLPSSIAKCLYDQIAPMLPLGFVVRREDPTPSQTQSPLFVTFDLLSFHRCGCLPSSDTATQKGKPQFTSATSDQGDYHLPPCP